MGTGFSPETRCAGDARGIFEAKIEIKRGYCKKIPKSTKCQIICGVHIPISLYTELPQNSVSNNLVHSNTCPKHHRTLSNISTLTLPFPLQQLSSPYLPLRLLHIEIRMHTFTQIHPTHPHSFLLTSLHTTKSSHFNCSRISRSHVTRYFGPNSYFHHCVAFLILPLPRYLFDLTTRSRFPLP